MERKTQNWPAGCLEEHLLTLRVLHRERAQLAEGEMDVAGRGCGSTWTLDWLTPKALHSPFLHAALSHSSEGKKSSNLCLPGSSECVTNYLQEAEEAMVSLPFPDTATLPQVHTVFMETVAVRHSLAQSCLILFDPMPYDLAISLLDNISKINEKYSNRHLYKMFVTALFTIGKKWKQPNVHKLMTNET